MVYLVIKELEPSDQEAGVRGWELWGGAEVRFHHVVALCCSILGQSMPFDSLTDPFSGIRWDVWQNQGTD